MPVYPPRTPSPPSPPSWTANYEQRRNAAAPPPRAPASPAAPQQQQSWPSPHPPNAAYVSDDGLVSYDEYGRRLDSVGNVAYSGGGGGGGYDAGAAAGAGDFGEIPEPYKLAFGAVFGPIDTYYTPQRGGALQAKNDYYALTNSWSQNTGQPLAPEVFPNVFGSYSRYATANKQAPSVAGMLGYVNSNMLTRPPTPPPTSYLKVSEI